MPMAMEESGSIGVPLGARISDQALVCLFFVLPHFSSHLAMRQYLLHSSSKSMAQRELNMEPGTQEALNKCHLLSFIYFFYLLLLQ